MLALDPKQTVEFTLESYATRPESEQPRFRVRFLTARDWATYHRILDEAATLAGAEFNAKMVEAARLALVGWRIRGADGVEQSFDPERLPDFLTLGELTELVYGTLQHVGAAEKALKKSDSPSQTSSAPSAPMASPAI